MATQVKSKTKALTQLAVYGRHKRGCVLYKTFKQKKLLHKGLTQENFLLYSKNNQPHCKLIKSIGQEIEVEVYEIPLQELNLILKQDLDLYKQKVKLKDSKLVPYILLSKCNDLGSNFFRGKFLSSWSRKYEKVKKFVKPFKDYNKEVTLTKKEQQELKKDDLKVKNSKEGKL